MRTIQTIILLFAGLLTACQDSETGITYITEQVTEDHSGITDEKARWNAYNLTNYVMEQQNLCYCPFGGDTCLVYVRGNKVVDVVRKANGESIFSLASQQYKTVDELFALAKSINPDSVASLVIQYDAQFGFPKVIAVDYSAQIADEEFMYITQNLKRLLP